MKNNLFEIWVTKWRRNLSLPIEWVTLSFVIVTTIYWSSMPVGDVRAAASAPESEGIMIIEEGVVDGSSPNVMAAPILSPSQMQALDKRRLELREQRDSAVDNNPPSPPGLPLVMGRASEVALPDEAEFHGTPGNLVLGRNNRNTNANNATTDELGSNRAEPSAANNGRNVFAAGNLRHAEFSSDGGATWTNVALPGGPAATPLLWGDQDIVIDNARRVFFHSALYLDDPSLDIPAGIVRIFVRRNPPAADCQYDINTGGFPDYPHLGLTKRFLYLTTSNTRTNGTMFRRIQRFNIDQMADCIMPLPSTAINQNSTATNPHRVWVPAGGTNNIETMYWGQLDNTTTFRIFSWPEAASSPSSVTRTISQSTFSNPDCRGGINNTDWIESSTAWSITGFRLRGVAAPGADGGPGVLAFYWNVGPDSVHTQGHIHAAVFSLSGLSLVAEPHIFNNGLCMGYPVVTANKRGDIGISLARGGRSGGGGGAATAVQAFVGIDDEFTSGIGSFGQILTTAVGTHNPPEGQNYGDYFTIHPHEPCETWFSATNYALQGGAGLANVNSRYVEFGRRQSERCWRAHADQTPTP